MHICPSSLSGHQSLSQSHPERTFLARGYSCRRGVSRLPLDRVKRNEKSYAHTRCRMIRNIEKTVLMTVTVYLKQQAKSVDQIVPKM